MASPLGAVLRLALRDSPAHSIGDNRPATNEVRDHFVWSISCLLQPLTPCSWNDIEDHGVNSGNHHRVPVPSLWNSGNPDIPFLPTPFRNLQHLVR